MTNQTAVPTFTSALTDRRATIPTIVPHIISGEELFVGPRISREDPSDPSIIISGCHDASAELVQRAVNVSRVAQREWELVPLRERIDRVRSAIVFVESHIDDWTVRVALETGKGHVPARAEILEGLEFLRRYSTHAEQEGAFEEELEAGDGTLANQSVLRPYGVFGVITPFNYPFALAAGPAIAAILAGNGVVIKTDHRGAWSGHAVFEMFDAMDLPMGLVNVVHGADGPGRALVSSDVDGLSFVGSAQVGAAILRQVAAGPYLRPVIAEMGGKNPVIVTDTADLDAAAEGIVFSAFDLAGQKCTALSRVLVTPGAHDILVKLVTEKAAALHMAGPADPGAFAGPVISVEAVERYERILTEARRAGFSVAGGGRLDTSNYLVRPVVISSVPEDHALARDEHFLPLITISEVPTFEAALEAANDVPLGLTAGLYTGDHEEIRMFLRRVEAGCINVNVPGHATTSWWPGLQTFGGWKGSGSTGKQGYGKWYVQQFARQQSRKLPVELQALLDD